MSDQYEAGLQELAQYLEGAIERIKVLQAEGQPDPQNDSLRELLVLWTVGTLYAEYEGTSDNPGFEFYCERISSKLMHYATDEFCEPLIDDDIREEARRRIAEAVKEYTQIVKGMK